MKISDMKKIKVGDQVALSGLQDTTWYTVSKKLSKNFLEILEKEYCRPLIVDINQIWKHKA